VWPTTPFGTWRLWDAYVAWPNLEPLKGQWQFDLLDRYVTLATNNNVELVLPLGLSPQWASARPNETSSYGPGNAAEPANMEDWQNYVTTVATRYKGVIHNYELWNEVNLTGFYSGSVDNMVEMAKEAYQIIKAIDPSARVISPSCVGDASTVNWFQQFLAKGGGNYADVIGYHFYVSPNAPEAMVPFINDTKKIMSNNNLSTKPLWNTESGWYIQNQDGSVVGSGSFSNVLSPDQASGYVARAYLLNWASGVDRFYWYAWDNYNMGFVEKDGKTVKAPAVAYGQVLQWLKGATMTSCAKNNQGSWVSQIALADGHTGWAVWNPDNSITMQLPTEWRAKQVRDLTGGATNIINNQVTIGPNPILIEN